MDNFEEAVAALNDLKARQVVAEYALGGAMALLFWSEPAATFDLDVFVILDQPGLLVSLEPIYSWARENGYFEHAEHILIAGIPVQLIPAPNELARSAILEAADLRYGTEPVRVIRPEYLIAMYLEESARTRKRMERVATLLDEGTLDRALLDGILMKYDLRLP
ncbi:MAG: hypothetical protein JOZ54_01320 [Acidobacteria bacterium]|nr:hypothetical protein [Acidobacteriota bacterium]